MPKTQKPSGDELRTLVEARISQAKERKIFQKAFAVVQALGQHTHPPSPRSCDDKWEFSQGGINICGYRQHPGIEVNIIISKNNQDVFSGMGVINHNSGYHDVFADDPDEIIRCYVPDQSWEKRLDQLAKPMIRGHLELIAKEQRQLRARFGL